MGSSGRNYCVYHYLIFLLRCENALRKVLLLFKNNKLIQLNVLVGSYTFLLYILNRFFFKRLYEWGFLHNYLNDVLAGILILSIANVIAVIGKQGRLMITSFVEILFFTFLCGLFWEYVTPLYLSYSVSDYLDVVSYMFGGLLYWIIFKLIKSRYPSLIG